jgi:Flp pilus assembly protein TadB
MSDVQMFGGLFGAGFAAAVMLLYAGLRPGAQTSSTPSRWLSLARRLDPRRLSGKGLRIALCAAGAAGVTAWTGWPIMALIGFALCWYLPRLLGPDRRSQANIDLSDAVASFAEMLRDTLSAAAGLQQTVLAVCPLAPAPIAAPCAMLAEQVATGTPLAVALTGWADQIDDRHADVVAACLVIAAKRQSGNTAALLSNVAATAREYAGIRRRAVAAQAKSRTAARIVVCTVLGLTGMLVFADRQFMSPYDTSMGQAVLLAAASVFAVALRWMDRIMHPAPEPRILTGLSTLATSTQETAGW